MRRVFKKSRFFLSSPRGCLAALLLLFSVLGAQERPLGLFQACSLFKPMRKRIERQAPQSACAYFLQSCEVPLEKIDVTFWREKWHRVFVAPFSGSCAQSVQSSQRSEQEMEETQNLAYQELERKTFKTEEGEVEGIRFQFQSQVWNCKAVVHSAEVALPKEVSHPEVALIINSGSQVVPSASFPRSFKSLLPLAASLGVVVMKIETDNPPKQFVVEDKLYDLTRGSQEVKNPMLHQLCSIFSTLFTPYVTADLAMQYDDSTFDFRTPMSTALRRAMTLLEWKFGVKRFLLTGGSQWGISLFLPAARDPRVAAIVPSAMHGLLDMKAYLSIIERSGFTYGIRLLTPAFARQSLEQLEKAPHLQSLSPVHLTLKAPLFLLGGTADEFYPLEGFLSLPGVNAPEKLLYIMPNVSHGQMSKRGESSRRAFFRRILTGKPSFQHSIKWLSERAQGEDWQVKVALQAEEKIKSVSLWWACEKGNGSFNDERWQALEGKATAGEQTFTVGYGNRCAYLAYFLEIGLDTSPDRAWVSSLPRFPKGSPGL